MFAEVNAETVFVEVIRNKTRKIKKNRYLYLLEFKLAKSTPVIIVILKFLIYKYVEVIEE